MSCVLGAALVGIDGVAVEVEVRISSLLPRVDIVGLPEAAVRESAARVRAAIASAGHSFPDRRVTVNLAPAGLRKGGAGLDLPIAIGILASSGALAPSCVDKVGLVGELALDGRLRPVRGGLSLALALRDAGCASVIMPGTSAEQAALAPGVEVYQANDLVSVLRSLQTGASLARATPPPLRPVARDTADLADVKGQERAKRALEVAAAGAHPLLLRGPPGSGKTMLARRLPGLLPPLSFEEALEATRIHGAAGQLDETRPIVTERPFRAPHHTASAAGLLGGGNPPRPGEISLAHRGVLFLDELPEFDRRTLEALRQVLEERRVVLARARVSCVFPAHFQLIAAANPCPCGWRFSPQRDCRCDEGAVARYASRISGPLLDRIDLHVTVPAVPWRDLDGAAAGPSSAEVRRRVAEARSWRQRRSGGGTGLEISDSELEAAARPTAEARALLARAVEKLGLTARGAGKVLRVARTVADFARERRVHAPAVAEALSYRDDCGEPGR